MTRRISRDEAVEEVEYLASWGLTPERIAERLQTRVDTLARALYRAGRPELAAPFTTFHRSLEPRVKRNRCADCDVLVSREAARCRPCADAHRWEKAS